MTDLETRLDRALTAADKDKEKQKHVGADVVTAIDAIAARRPKISMHMHRTSDRKPPPGSRDKDRWRKAVVEYLSEHPGPQPVQAIVKACYRKVGKDDLWLERSGRGGGHLPHAEWMVGSGSVVRVARGVYALVETPSPRTETAESETAIVARIRLAVGEHASDVVLWRNNVGVAQHKDRPVRYGLCSGSADLVGVLYPWGRFLALEVKRPGEEPRPNQHEWAELVRKFGGFAAVVDSPESALAAIERARGGGDR